MDIVNQKVGGPFSSDNPTYMYCNIAALFSPGIDYVPYQYSIAPNTFYCIIGGNIYLADKDNFNCENIIPLYGDSYFVGNNFSILDVLYTNNLLNYFGILNPGVHHIIIEAQVNYGSETYTLYDDIEVAVSEDNPTGQTDVDGHYDVYYLSTDPSKLAGFYRARVVIPNSFSNVNDYSAPLFNEYVDLGYSLGISKVVSLSASQDGKYLAIGVKTNETCGVSPCYKVYVVDMRYDFPSYIGPIEVETNWFSTGDFGSTLDYLTEGDAVNEMNPQISPEGLFGNYVVVFEGVIRGPNANGVPTDYKRVFAARISPSFPYYTPGELGELRWQYLTQLLSDPGKRKGYNSSQLSIGYRSVNPFTFAVSPGPSVETETRPCFVVAYSSTFSHCEGIPEFNIGESHINFAFIIVDNGPPYAYYGEYFDEGNVNPIDHIVDHPGPACSNAYVNADATAITYIGRVGGYNLPFYNIFRNDFVDVTKFVGDNDDPAIQPFYDQGCVELPRRTMHHDWDYWSPSISRQLTGTYNSTGCQFFRGVFRESIDLEAAIIVYQIGCVNVGGGKDMFCMVDASAGCAIDYAHDDWPLISSDGKGFVFSTHGLHGDNIIFVHIPINNPLDNDCGNGPFTPYNYHCIRLTQDGQGTQPVCTSFISNG